ncbi:MAG: PQQ-dependent sugar dehydrogenase [Gaiella sp.]
MRRVVLIALVAAGAAVASGIASAAETVTAVRLVPVVRGFDQPVLATQAPGEPGRIYVVEQRGLVRVVERGRIRPTPFLDARSLVVAGGEQGLLGLAFPADYRRSRVFYVNYSARADGATIVARFRVVGGRADPASREVLLRVAQPYANHNGGNLAFGPDGKLWVGLGDGGSGGDPENRAQDPDTLLGKLFTLDVAAADPKPVLVGLGLRNPWRYAFDRRTGDLWIGDVGQGEIEEINVLRRGSTGLVNFGWDVFEGSARFEDKPLGPGTLVKPIAEYSHAVGCSVTGGVVVRGPQVPALRGRYVYGDYCSGRVWSIATTGGKPRLERIRVPQLVSFGEALNGTVYAISHDGTIFRLSR